MAGQTGKSLLDLPVEISSLVCELLRDVHPASLSSLAYTSRVLRTIAFRHILRKVKFDFLTHADLKKRTDRLTKLCDKYAAYNHVRVLELYNKDPLLSFEVSPEEFEDKGWKPFIDLVLSLPYLSDIHFYCNDAFPPRALKAIHQQDRPCKLHIRYFNFSDLNAIAENSGPEYRLLTSSKLHSLGLSCPVQSASETKVCCLELASLWLIRVLLPNVEYVSLVCSRETHWKTAAAIDPKNVDLWRQRVFQGCSSKKRLRRLDFYADRAIVELDVFHWSEHFDLDALRELKVHIILGHGRMFGFLDSGLSAIGCLQRAEFASLDALSITMPTIGQPRDVLRHGHNQVQEFVLARKPLSVLEITGLQHYAALSPLLALHGNTLRTLCLGHSLWNEDRYGCTYEEAQTIVENCPQLERLALAIFHFQDTTNGVLPLYTSLTQHPKIQYLQLNFHFSIGVSMQMEPRRTRTTSFNEQFQTSNSHPHLVYVLAYGTRCLNERLPSKSKVFNDIFKLFTASRPENSLPLKNLYIVVDWFVFPRHGATSSSPQARGHPQPMAANRSPPSQLGPHATWMIEPHPRDDRPNQVVVHENLRSHRRWWCPFFEMEDTHPFWNS